MKYQHLLVLLALPLIAAVQIHTVYYDPIQTQLGGEFVLLHNDAETPVNVSDWTIATTISEQDATLQGSIGPKSYYLVADTGFSEEKDESGWPQADHEETLTLTNTDGYVQLKDANQQVQSTVGWGEAQRSEETPHPGAQKGEALVRVNTTGDNANDFRAQQPHFSQEERSTNSSLSIHITNTPPKIRTVLINNKSAQDEVIIESQQETLHVVLDIEDNNTQHNISVYANAQQMITNDTGVRAQYAASIPYANEVLLRVEDGEHEITRLVTLTSQPLQPLRIPEGVELEMAPNTSAKTTLPIHNQATHPVDIQLRASIPQWANEHVVNITYELNEETYQLNKYFRTHQVHIAPEQTLELELTVHASNSPANTYPGQIIIAGVPAQ